MEMRDNMAVPEDETEGLEGREGGGIIGIVCVGE
jgi:hypothetical protein